MGRQEEEGRGEFDVVASGGRYLLGASEDAYQIRDHEGTLIASFPPTEGGFEAADAHYRALRRADRRARWGAHNILKWTALGGLVVWVAGDAALSIWNTFLFGASAFGGFPVPEESLVYRLLGAVGAVALRVWVGALAALAALRLTPLTPSPPGPGSTPTRQTSQAEREGG